MAMSSDEELEYENDRASLLPDNKDQSQKLHEDMGRFVLPLSDNEGSNENSQHNEGSNENSQHSEGITIEERAAFINSQQTNYIDPVFPKMKATGYLLQWIPKRFIVLGLLLFGNFNMYCVRMCLSVTIIAMTTKQEINRNGTGLHDMSNEPEFHWDKKFQGTILACLYWGYTATQIPGGLLTFQYGGTFLLGLAIFGSSVLTLATPFIIHRSVNVFIALRIIEGLLLGMVAPAGQTIISKWSPIYERSIFATFGASGFLLGTVFANSLSGILAGSSWGWPSVFYFFGVSGIAWYILWLYFVYEEPSDHPNISEKELTTIGKHWHTKLSFRQIPWGYILTSLPVWCLIIVGFSECWGFYTFILSFPGYLEDVLKFDIEKIGFTSSIPYVLCIVIAPTWGLIIDTLRRKRYITTIFGRKLSTFLGLGLSSMFIIAIAHTRTSITAIILATIAISITSINASGPSPNLVEIAPKYAGVIMGIVNFACNIPGFICPEIVGALTEHGDPARQWVIVFYITAGIQVFGMLVFLIFASSEKQPWADH